MLTVTDFMELFIEFYSYLTKEEFDAGLDIVTIREWNRTRRFRPAKKPDDGHQGTTAPSDEKQQGFLISVLFPLQFFLSFTLSSSSPTHLCTPGCIFI